MCWRNNVQNNIFRPLFWEAKMVYKPGYLRERSKRLIYTRQLCIALGVALLGVRLFVSELWEVCAGPWSLFNIGYILLFLLTAWLTFSWTWSTQNEFDLLFEWLDPERYEPPSGTKETFVMLMLALLIVVLLFASRSPLWYGLVFTTYSLVDLRAGKIIRKELGDVILKSKNRAETDLNDKSVTQKAELYLKGLDILYLYYIGRAHIKRLFFIVFSSGVGLALAILWFVGDMKFIGFCSYVAFIFTLVVSQIMIWRWRIIRDIQLRPVKAELNELNRTDQ
jgi:hypothetical protein